MRCARRACVPGIAAVALIACAGEAPQHALSPAGPESARIAELWWLMFWLAAAVSVGVTAVLLVAVQRSRLRSRGKHVREIDGRLIVMGGGVIIPAAILFTVLLYSYRVGTWIYPPAVPDADTFTVEVIGHQFWWQVRYPAHDVITANEIHIPAGQRVRFLVSAPDVIHSFWIPRLHGKIDMIPGRQHELWMEAREPGVFRGQCAEYCGLSHALMAFWVIALPADEFAAWLDQRRRPRPAPSNLEEVRGRAVFIAEGCDRCHATPDEPPPAGFRPAAPDLSNLAARRSLAAGTLPNDRESLARWITDPQRIKPGSHMPPTLLPSAELQALLTYLQSLR